MVNSEVIDDVNAAVIALSSAKKYTKIPVATIDKSYGRVSGTRIPFAKLGFPTLIDYLKTVPGVKVNFENNIYYFNFVGANSQYNSDDSIPDHQSNNDSLNKSYKCKLQYSEASSDSSDLEEKMNKNIPKCILTILNNSPEGCSKKKIINELNYNYCISESYRSLDYHLKMISKFIVIEDGLIYKKRDEDIDFQMTVSDNSKKKYLNNVNTTSTVYKSVGEILVTDLIISNKSNTKTRLIEVEVVESYSPSFFWIHLLKYKKEFNTMMTSLEKFYKVNYQDHKIPTSMLERGLDVACIFDGKWHRAIIKSVDPNNKVTVMFYDFGTISNFPSNEIWYLHQSFTELPAQAVPCSLYSVAPYNSDKWPKRIRDYFNQWVYEKPLWAHIVDMDVEKKSMSVTLADTSGNDDFIINDWMVHKKMAKIRKMNCIDPEDMKLYVNEFSEYYVAENGVYETIIPTTRHPESNCGTNLFIHNSFEDVDCSENNMDLYKYDWRLFKSQIRDKIDEIVMLTIKTYNDFTKKNMESSGHGIIRNVVGESLTDSLIEIVSSFLDLDLQAKFTQVANSLNESIVEIDDEQLALNTNITGGSSFDNISNLVPSLMGKETKQSKLETSIQEAVTKIVKNRIINGIENLTVEDLNPLAHTSPFNDCFIDDKLTENETRPSSLTSRLFDHEPELQQTVHATSPVLHDSSKHWNPFL